VVISEEGKSLSFQKGLDCVPNRKSSKGCSMITQEERRIIEEILWNYNADWFAVDREGFVAHFRSQDGSVPLVCLPLLDEYGKFKDYINSLEAVTDSILMESSGRNDLWINIAKRGLYSYDFRDEKNLVYRVCARPVLPTHIDHIPPHYHPLLRTVLFDDLQFNDLPLIDLCKMGVRNSWEHRWEAPLGNNLST
jgi:hypothetical protein